MKIKYGDGSGEVTRGDEYSTKLLDDGGDGIRERSKNRATSRSGNDGHDRKELLSKAY